MVRKKEIIEKLAEIEHVQWRYWSEAVWHDFHNIRRALDEAVDIDSALRIIKERGKRWKENWRPYKELDEKTKEHDRVWARKVLTQIEKTHIDKQKVKEFLDTYADTDKEFKKWCKELGIE